jgi:hypothetical protein
VPPAGDSRRGRSLTIGEAAARLSAEFPGIRPETLRALEQHGLVVPERTSSGFRRYTEGDLDAVRDVLSDQPGARRAEPEPEPPAADPEPYPVWVPAAQTPPPPPEPAPAAARRPLRDGAVPAPLPAAFDTPVTFPRSPAPSDEAASSASQSSAAATIVAIARRRAARWPEPEYFTPELGEVALGREGLARAAGISEESLDELAAHGLLSGRDPASGTDLLVARAAAELLGHGIEARQLAPSSVAATRAAALVRAARGGSSRAGTAQTAAALVRLEAALLRAALLDD